MRTPLVLRGVAALTAAVLGVALAGCSSSAAGEAELARVAEELRGLPSVTSVQTELKPFDDSHGYPPIELGADEYELTVGDRGTISVYLPERSDWPTVRAVVERYLQLREEPAHRIPLTLGLYLGDDPTVTEAEYWPKFEFSVLSLGDADFNLLAAAQVWRDWVASGQYEEVRLRRTLVYSDRSFPGIDLTLRTSYDAPGSESLALLEEMQASFPTGRRGLEIIGWHADGQGHWQGVYSSFPPPETMDLVRALVPLAEEAGWMEFGYVATIFGEDLSPIAAFEVRVPIWDAADPPAGAVALIQRLGEYPGVASLRFVDENYEQLAELNTQSCPVIDSQEAEERSRVLAELWAASGRMLGDGGDPRGCSVTPMDFAGEE